MFITCWGMWLTNHKLNSAWLQWLRLCLRARKTREHLWLLPFTHIGVHMEEPRLTALGIPCACQNFGLFGSGRKALRQDVTRFPTQPSSRRIGLFILKSLWIHLSSLQGFAWVRCTDSYFLQLMDLLIFIHTNLFVIFFLVKV
uniref:Uncharacterized protein n=1 Tax=Rousettus aegyptiacus TaxID=9407 RepID=A0A7J8C2H2_ROUAE|nr:hypothetical protein HJG63_009382 [Rousettus aegyptiacus]